MKAALKCAKKAAAEGEVPIGAVVVCDGKIIARGYNKRTKRQIATAHAEIEAIEKACKKQKSWRIPECEIYVTLEPCPMCAGAILNARIRRVTFGAYDPKNGALASVMHMYDYPFTHKPAVEGGVLENECAEVLSDFFKKLRKKA